MHAVHLWFYQIQFKKNKKSCNSPANNNNNFCKKNSSDHRRFLPDNSSGTTAQPPSSEQLFLLLSPLPPITKKKKSKYLIFIIIKNIYIHLKKKVENFNKCENITIYYMIWMKFLRFAPHIQPFPNYYFSPRRLQKKI